jgi:hypothetical protein
MLPGRQVHEDVPSPHHASFVPRRQPVASTGRRPVGKRRRPVRTLGSSTKPHNRRVENAIPTLSPHRYRHLCRANRQAPPESSLAWASACRRPVLVRSGHGTREVRLRRLSVAVSISLKLASNQVAEEVSTSRDHHAPRRGVNRSWGQRVTGRLVSQGLQLGNPDPGKFGLRRRSQG